MTSLATTILAMAWLTATAAGAAPEGAQGPADYVALGSSFAAGPDVGRPDPAAPPPCARSLDNYAHKLAARRHLILEDRSCSGARTADLTSHRQFGLSPQIEGVGPGVRLITVTIGGNDVSYLGDLGALSCRNQGGSGCAPSPDETLEARFATLRTAYAELLAQLRTRAPTARIAVVDYVTILPDQGVCPAQAPLTEADMARARDRAARLQRLTAEVAAAAGATLVRASAVTAGHDVCAPHPWVNGWHDPGPGGRPLATYHPRIEAMEAVAAELDRVLPRGLDH